MFLIIENEEGSGMVNSKPLNSKTSKKFETDTEKDDNIKSQRVGTMFDRVGDTKINLKTRFEWKWRDFKGFFYDIKHVILNHIKWHKTMKKIRPWEGFDGLIDVMQTHLGHYADCEEKHGSAEEEYTKRLVDTARETITLLERMREPIDYSSRRRDAVEARYPKYQSLITEYVKGSVGYSGDFVTQGNGWTGKESGNNPREGYFEFINGRFELETSPNQDETNRLLAELEEYHKEVDNAYKQAEVDSSDDFDRLGKLLKENLYSWWD